MTDREQLVRGLRDLADFVESNPSIRLSLTSNEVRLLAFCDTSQELADMARSHAPVEKHYGSGPASHLVYLRKQFGPFTIVEWIANRELVCRKTTTTSTVHVEAQPAIEAHDVEVEETCWVCDKPWIAHEEVTT